MTDHAPLQWLSAQKMEGLLQRWALAMQEYAFAVCIGKEQRTPMLMQPSVCPSLTSSH